MKVFDTSPISAFNFLKRTYTKVFRDPQQAMTNPWHLQRLEFSPNQECMGAFMANKKQWLKRVTGSALISVSWENAKEFSTIVRSSLSLLIMCRAAAAIVLSCVSDLLCFHTSVQNDQNIAERQCGESSSQWCACPLIFLTKNNGRLITNGTRTERASSAQRGVKRGENNHYPKTCSIMW